VLASFAVLLSLVVVLLLSGVDGSIVLLLSAVRGRAVFVCLV
jgi:hypothetical protein